MIQAHELIKSCRKALGLSDTQVAEKSGLSIYEYGDMELRDDEIFSIASLHQVKQVCGVLRIDLFELYNLRCVFCERGNAAFSAYSLSRDQLVRQQRNALRLSEQELGNRIGFEAGAIRDMEANPEYLEGWSYELINEFAAILHVPVQVLLDVSCSKCGR